MRTNQTAEPEAPLADEPATKPRRHRNTQPGGEARRRPSIVPASVPDGGNLGGLDGSTKVETIQARLEARYGVAEWHPRNGPVDELVACILSQHTSDVNSLRAFDRLKSAYSAWEAAIEAPVEEIAETIRCGGLANSKAVRIQEVLRRILAAEGRISLDCLDAMTDTEARAYLTDLPGVGPKTAAIVLSFALGRPVLPVDTHIFRVAWRLGLIEKKIGEAKAHDALQAQVAPDNVFRFHVALIQHGRQVCKAPTPRCNDCPLTDLCRYYQEQSDGQSSLRDEVHSHDYSGR